MTKPIGETLEVKFDRNDNYTLDQVKEIVFKAYINPKISSYFDKSYAHLGFFNEDIIDKFANDVGEDCFFWEYTRSKEFKKHNPKSKVHIYILTTEIDERRGDDSFVSNV